MRHRVLASKSSRLASRIARTALSIAAIAMMFQGALPQASYAAAPTAEQLKETATKSLAAMSDFKDDNFSMKYPTSWERETASLPPSQILRAKALFGAVNLIVVADKSPSADTIDNFADMNVQALKAAFGDKLTFVSNEPIELKNAKGRLLVMSQEIKEEGKTPFKFKQYMVLFVSNGTGYGLTCTTVDSWYPEFEPVFKAMANSVEVSAATAATPAGKAEAKSDK